MGSEARQSDDSFVDFLGSYVGSKNSRCNLVKVTRDAVELWRNIKESEAPPAYISDEEASRATKPAQPNRNDPNFVSKFRKQGPKKRAPQMRPNMVPQPVKHPDGRSVEQMRKLLDCRGHRARRQTKMIKKGPLTLKNGQIPTRSRRPLTAASSVSQVALCDKCILQSKLERAKRHLTNAINLKQKLMKIDKPTNKAPNASTATAANAASGAHKPPAASQSMQK